MSREAKIATIRDFIPRLEALIDGLSAEQLTTPYNAPEWTVAQNVHHLADAHINSYLIFKRVLTEDAPRIQWPDQDRLAELPEANSPDLSYSLTILRGLHERWALMLEAIEDWTLEGTSTGSGKTYSLDTLLDIYSRHCDAHDQQIQDVLDKMPTN